MTENRLEWVDISKGIGIILVVLGHTIVPQLRENLFGGFLWIFIYNFHMPLFFFLSGYLFEKGLDRYKNTSAFIVGKLKLLMLPYVSFSILAYLFIALAMHFGKAAAVLESGGYTVTSLGSAIFQILTYSSHADKHLWFVYSLFLVFLINILMPKLMKSRPMLIILLGLYISKAFVQYFGIIDYITSDLFFFSLGRIVLNSKTAEKNFNPLLCGCIFIITNCIYSYFYIGSMPNGILKALLYIVRCISSVSGIFTVCTFAYYLTETRLNKPLSALGRYSYDIYLIHAPFLVSGTMGILLAYTPLPAPLDCAAVLVIGIALPYVISKFIIRKIPVLSLILLGK